MLMTKTKAFKKLNKLESDLIKLKNDSDDKLFEEFRSKYLESVSEIKKRMVYILKNIVYLPILRDSLFGSISIMRMDRFVRENKNGYRPERVENIVK